MQKNIYDPEYIKTLFDRMSKSYERMNYITSFGFSIRWRKHFLEHTHFENDNIEIIDLMTGMGETWNATKKKYPKSNLTVVDFSDGMLQFAHHKNKKYFNNEVKILSQDVLNNNLESNKYDLVTSAFGLKTFNEDQLKQLAIETKRILKPNGKFTFIEVSVPDNTFLKFLYGIYLGKIIPLIGNREEYKMLWEYTNKFGNTKKAKKIFEENGLKTEYKSYFFGCATGIFGHKEY